MYKKAPFFLLLFFNILFTTISHSQKKEFNNKKDSVLTRFYNLVNTNPNKAIVLADSLELFPSIIKADKLKFYSSLGLSYNYLNNYSQAFIYFNKSLEEAKKIKAYSEAGLIHTDISNIFLELNDTISFNKHLDLALDFYKKSNNNEGVLDVIQSKAFMELNYENYRKSNIILHKYQNDFKKSSDSLLYLVSNFMFLNNYLKLNNKDLAFKYLDTIHFSKSEKYLLDYVYYENASYFQIADYYHNKGSVDSTLLYVNKINKKDVAFDSFFMTEYYKFLSDVYKENGDVEMYQKVNDSLFKIQEEIIVNNGKSEINKEKERIKIMRIVNKQKDIKYSYLIIPFVLILILLFYYRKKILKLKEHSQKIEQELPNSYLLLEEKEKLRIVLNERNKKLESFKQEIKSISKLSNSTSQREKIKKLSKDIIIESSKTNGPESQFEELKIINKLFFENLEETYPGLNNLDKTICYYIHIDFMNKEIADFLNTSVRSIEGRRYRITKKIVDIAGRKINIKDALNQLMLP